MALFAEGRGYELSTNPVWVGTLTVGGWPEPITGEYVNPPETSAFAQAYRNWLAILPDAESGKVDTTQYGNELALRGMEVGSAIPDETWSRYKTIYIGELGIMGMFSDVPRGATDVNFNDGLHEYVGFHQVHCHKPGKPVKVAWKERFTTTSLTS